MVDRLNVFAYATDEELARAYRIARRFNQWRICYRIRCELVTR